MKGQGVERKKAVAIIMLFAVSTAIALMGLTFCVYSAVNRVELIVLQAKVPGVFFGLAAAFLGARYFLAVRKLKAEDYKASSRFSLGNFKK